MSERPTPETDAFSVEFKTVCGSKKWVPVDLSRRLERERDEAREALENHMAATIHTCHDECKRPMCVLRRERDEAREMVKQVCKSQFGTDVTFLPKEDDQ